MGCVQATLWLEPWRAGSTVWIDFRIPDAAEAGGGARGGGPRRYPLPHSARAVSHARLALAPLPGLFGFVLEDPVVHHTRSPPPPPPSPRPPSPKPPPQPPPQPRKFELVSLVDMAMAAASTRTAFDYDDGGADDHQPDRAQPDGDDNEEEDAAAETDETDIETDTALDAAGMGEEDDDAWEDVAMDDHAFDDRDLDNDDEEDEDEEDEVTTRQRRRRRAATTVGLLGDSSNRLDAAWRDSLDARGNPTALSFGVRPLAMASGGGSGAGLNGGGSGVVGQMHSLARASAAPLSDEQALALLSGGDGAGSARGSGCCWLSFIVEAPPTVPQRVIEQPSITCPESDPRPPPPLPEWQRRPPPPPPCPPRPPPPPRPPSPSPPPPSPLTPPSPLPPAPPPPPVSPPPTLLSVAWSRLSTATPLKQLPTSGPARLAVPAGLIVLAMTAIALCIRWRLRGRAAVSVAPTSCESACDPLSDGEQDDELQGLVQTSKRKHAPALATRASSCASRLGPPSGARREQRRGNARPLSAHERALMRGHVTAGAATYLGRLR